MTEIPFEEWKKMDLRIGEILDVQEHPDAGKLFVLTVDLGTERRTVVAGIKPYYTKEELKGKQVVIFTNLHQRIIRGIKSEGMLLAAGEKDGTVALLQPEKNVNNGTAIQ